MLVGCAYQPIVDRPGPTYAQDLTECRAAAQQAAGPGTGAAVGAGLGYVLGQVLSRATGNRSVANEAGRGAAVLGGASGAGAGMQQEAAIVRNCLRGRGHRVLN